MPPTRSSSTATRIDDPVLAQEVADFSQNCYGPARARLFMSRLELSEEQMHDVRWIGSRFFVYTPEPQAPVEIELVGRGMAQFARPYTGQQRGCADFCVPGIVVYG